MESFEDISLEKVSLKAKSKCEIYNFIETSGNIYLSPIQDCHCESVREFATRVKRFILFCFYLLIS